ncbi:positive regulation of sphingomyelin catabolic process [Pleodorina starrii]|nr:positive regulation of sphingomyelin catabolic process [Pleodorina starrii]
MTVHLQKTGYTKSDWRKAAFIYAAGQQSWVGIDASPSLKAFAAEFTKPVFAQTEAQTDVVGIAPGASVVVAQHGTATQTGRDRSVVEFGLADFDKALLDAGLASMALEASGGFGKVVKVHLAGMGFERESVVKVYHGLNPAGDGDETEAARAAVSQTLAVTVGLRHERLLDARAVVRADASGEVVGFVYDFHPGSLHGWIRTSDSGGWPAKSLPVLCHVLADAADATGYLHHKGLVHRDIKPANILVRPLQAGALVNRTLLAPRFSSQRTLASQVDFNGRGVLGDFDLVARAGRVRGQAGTPGYRGHEGEAMTETHGHAFDVYSMGACMLDILDGGGEARKRWPAKEALTDKLKMKGPVAAAQEWHYGGAVASLVHA